MGSGWERRLSSYTAVFAALSIRGARNGFKPFPTGHSELWNQRGKQGLVMQAAQKEIKSQADERGKKTPGRDKGHAVKIIRNCAEDKIGNSEKQNRFMAGEEIGKQSDKQIKPYE